MTPKVIIFENVSGFIDGTPRYVSLPKLVKIDRWKLPKGRLDYHTKNSRSAGLVLAPILSKMGRWRPKLPERCHPNPIQSNRFIRKPLDMSTFTEFGPDCLRFVGLIPERSLDALQKDTVYSNL